MVRRSRVVCRLHVHDTETTSRSRGACSAIVASASSLRARRCVDTTVLASARTREPRSQTSEYYRHAGRRGAPLGQAGTASPCPRVQACVSLVPVARRDVEE
eukprot:5727267-Prymnesium_polylepis.1